MPKQSAHDITATVFLHIPTPLDDYDYSDPPITWRDALTQLLTRALPDDSVITIISGSAILPGTPGRVPPDHYVESGYFLDQAPELPSPIVCKLLEADESPTWELDAAALYRLESGYAVIYLSGCSCWPDCGGTYVYAGQTAEEAIESAQSEYGQSRRALKVMWLDGGRPS